MGINPDEAVEYGAAVQVCVPCGKLGGGVLQSRCCFLCCFQSCFERAAGILFCWEEGHWSVPFEGVL
jgi:hypothetical protein